MSILNNIEKLKPELSSTDLKLAEFILENLDEISGITSSSLAKISKTSPATVIRFSKKLGYKKYSDFKIAISKAVESRVQNEYKNVSFEDSFQVSKHKLIKNAEVVIDSMKDLLDEESISKIINSLFCAKKIYVYGVGSSSLAAEDFRQKWTKIGKTVIFDKDITMMKQQMLNDVVPNLFLGISHSGKNKEILLLIKECKEHVIPTIGVTQLGNTKLSKEVDMVVQTARTSAIDNGHYGSGATHSVLIQLISIDILYFFYLKFLQSTQ